MMRHLLLSRSADRAAPLVRFFETKSEVSRAATRRNANLTLRYFLSLLTALNFFLGFVYMLYSGVFGSGDYALAIQGLPHPGLLRVLEVIVSILLCVGTVGFLAPSFEEFPEKLWRLALVPHVSDTLFFCLAGLRYRQ